jgi:CRISPR-associated protein Cas2
MEVYVVCFDISDDALRRRIAQVLLGYGDRVQRSVFEVSVRDRSQLDALRVKLAELVDPGDQDVRLYRLCARCREASGTLSGERVGSFPALVVI